MCNLIKRRKYASQSQHTYTATRVNRYINSHRTADTPGGIQRLMCVIFKMKSYYMKKEPVVKKMCFIVFKKYYHLSSRHVNKKSITLRSFYTQNSSLCSFFQNTRAKLRLETLVPFWRKKCPILNSL